MALDPLREELSKHLTTVINSGAALVRHARDVQRTPRNAADQRRMARGLVAVIGDPTFREFEAAVERAMAYVKREAAACGLDFDAPPPATTELPVMASAPEDRRTKGSP